jgi:hypothetical protein
MNAPVVYSFQWLCEMMQSRQPVSLLTNGGKVFSGVINGISVEDGSGRHWLVKMDNQPSSFYVRAE